jgi:hypothetical protein
MDWLGRKNINKSHEVTETMKLTLDQINYNLIFQIIVTRH